MFDAYQLERSRTKGIDMVRWTSLQQDTRDAWLAAARAGRDSVLAPLVRCLADNLAAGTQLGGGQVEAILSRLR